MNTAAAVKSYAQQLRALTEPTYKVYDYAGQSSMKTAFEMACDQVGYQCRPIGTANERTFPPGTVNYKTDFTVTTYAVEK